MQETQETQVWSLGQENPLEKGMGNSLQYSGLENSMDRGAWQAAVRGVTRVIHDWLANTSVSSMYMYINFYNCVYVEMWQIWETLFSMVNYRSRASNLIFVVHCLIISHSSNLKLSYSDGLPSLFLLHPLVLEPLIDCVGENDW